MTHDDYDEVRPGERDPRRPPGLALVVVAAAVLVTFGYVMFPHHQHVEPALAATDAAPQANTNPPDAPAGK